MQRLPAAPILPSSMEDDMNSFWTNWLKIWCVGVIAFAAALTAAAFPATDGFARFYYDLVYWPLDGASTFCEEARFTVAILGAVTLGWGLLMLGCVSLGEKIGAPMWRLMFQSMTVWFVVDSAVSIAAGVPGNAIANTAIYAEFLAPMIFSGVLASRRTAMA
jgi:hypothetical protein